MSARNWADSGGGDVKDPSRVLPVPYWTFFARIAQIVLALLLLILTAYSASKLGSNAAGFGLTWFSFILTIIYFVYLGVAFAVRPAFYHPLIHLPFEILINIFWLSSWAVLASDASSLGRFDDYLDYSLPSSLRGAINALKAAAVFGAIEWVLFTITLVFLVLAFIKYTKSSTVHRGLEAGDDPKASELNTYAPTAAPAPVHYPAA